jgi:hypothetical protein
MARGQSSLRGRDASSGQFVPVEQARARPSSATVERVPKPGFGADSSSPRGRDAGTGRFVTIEEAERRSASTVVEQVPHPSKT